MLWSIEFSRVWEGQVRASGLYRPFLPSHITHFILCLCFCLCLCHAATCILSLFLHACAASDYHECRHTFTAYALCGRHWAAHCGVPCQGCRKGDPFQGPKPGSCLTLRNELSEDIHVPTKQEILLGKGPPGGEQECKGTQENCSATWLAVSGFMVMGLVSRLSLANHSNSESFLVVHASLSQDGC